MPKKTERRGSMVRKKKSKDHAEESTQEMPQQQIIEIWENTYQMKPKNKFKSYEVTKIIKQVFDEYLKKELVYDVDAVKELSKNITNTVRTNIKNNLNIPRYKIICQTFIGQIKNNGVQISSKWLWDPNNDNQASMSWKNDHFFVTTLVFGLYFE